MPAARSTHSPRVVVVRAGDMENWPFEVIEVDGKPKIVVEVKGEKQSYFPEEISSMILAEMKATAETYLGKTVRAQTKRTHANRTCTRCRCGDTLLANRPIIDAQV